MRMALLLVHFVLCVNVYILGSRYCSIAPLVVGSFVSFLFPWLSTTHMQFVPTFVCHIYFNFFLLHVKSKNKVSSHQYVVHGNGVLPTLFGKKRKQSTLRWNEHLV